MKQVFALPRRKAGYKMKLVTFQTFNALKDLINNGYLVCDEKYIDKKKMGITYNWVKEKMEKSGLECKKYPIWCWVKYNNLLCPPNRKGKKIEGFDVKITFNKDENDVFITDFIKYSFLLNYQYIPDDLNDLKEFRNKITNLDITDLDLIKYVRRDKYENFKSDKYFLEIVKLVEKSFDKCICDDGSILQGCVSKINLEDVEKIEFLTDDNIMSGSINYVRSNGKRKNWIDAYINTLK